MLIDRRCSPRDRRAAGRAPLTAAVAARVRRATHLAQAVSIGPFGMSLRYAGDAARCLPRTPVALAFQLPGADEVIRVRGEVVFDRSDGACRTAGVRFAALRPGDARRIADYVADGA